jgi:hypothetical protein
VTDIRKHPSLLPYGKKYRRKKLYSTDPKSTFTAVKFIVGLTYGRNYVVKGVHDGATTFGATTVSLTTLSIIGETAAFLINDSHHDQAF